MRFKHAPGVLFHRALRCVSDPNLKHGRTSVFIYNSWLHVVSILEEIKWILLLYCVTNNNISVWFISSFHLWSKIHLTCSWKEAITQFLTSFPHFIHHHSQHKHSRTQGCKSKISAGKCASKMHNDIAWLTVWWNVYFIPHKKTEILIIQVFVDKYLICNAIFTSKCIHKNENIVVY